MMNAPIHKWNLRCCCCCCLIEMDATKETNKNTISNKISDAVANTQEMRELEEFKSIIEYLLHIKKFASKPCTIYN